MVELESVQTLKTSTTSNRVTVRIPEDTPTQATVAEKEKGHEEGKRANCTWLSLEEKTS